MSTTEDDRLESVDLQSSPRTEKALVRLGELLYDAVMNAERLGELEIVMDAVAGFSTMVSFYGEKTGRLPKSLRVDLNKAA